MLMSMRCFVTGAAELQLPYLTARMPGLLFTTTTPIHFAASVVEIVYDSALQYSISYFFVLFFVFVFSFGSRVSLSE